MSQEEKQKPCKPASFKQKLQSVLAKRERISTLTSSGAEVCDPRPLTLPTGIRVPPTQEQRFKQMMAQHQMQVIADAEYRDETDFEYVDEDDLLTPYERSAFLFEMNDTEGDLFNAPTSPPAGVIEATPAPTNGKAEATQTAEA